MKPENSLPFKESAGLRQTLLAYLPQEVGEALSVLTSYIYDQALAEGEPPGGEGYVSREVAALLSDLRYVEARLAALAEVEGQTNLSADEVVTLAQSKAGLQHLRRARQALAPDTPGAGQDGKEE